MHCNDSTLNLVAPHSYGVTGDPWYLGTNPAVALLFLSPPASRTHRAICVTRDVTQLHTCSSRRNLSVRFNLHPKPTTPCTEHRLLSTTHRLPLYFASDGPSRPPRTPQCGRCLVELVISSAYAYQPLGKEKRLHYMGPGIPFASRPSRGCYNRKLRCRPPTVFGYGPHERRCIVVLEIQHALLHARPRQPRTSKLSQPLRSIRVTRGPHRRRVVNSTSKRRALTALAALRCQDAPTAAS